MILVDAIYINESGGKILLEYFIEVVQEKRLLNRFFFLLDKRLISKKAAELGPAQVNFLDASEKSRKLFYANSNLLFSSVFCFANVPPPSGLNNKKVNILFHNTLLLDNRCAGFSLLNRGRFLLKREYIRLKNRKDYNWIVQTESVADMVVKKLKIKKENISVVPFFKTPVFALSTQRKQSVKKDNELHFLYVASSSKQKNHNRLIKACVLAVANGDFKLNLHLTLSAQSDPTLLGLIQRSSNNNFNIVNHGLCTYEQVSQLYQACTFFLFPSLTESFGLPLIEAALAGCKVVASDLPFVYDVVMPSLTFNPMDVNCIANAIIACFEREVPPTSLRVKNEIDQLITKIQ